MTKRLGPEKILTSTPDIFILFLDGIFWEFRDFDFLGGGGDFFSFRGLVW
jgi:hypothetical protein